MSYRELLYLKYRLGLSTEELMRRHPQDLERVSHVALLDIPEDTLREVVREETTLSLLTELKRQLAEFL